MWIAVARVINYTNYKNYGTTQTTSVAKTTHCHYGTGS